MFSGPVFMKWKERKKLRNWTLRDATKSDTVTAVKKSGPITFPKIASLIIASNKTGATSVQSWKANSDRLLKPYELLITPPKKIKYETLVKKSLAVPFNLSARPRIAPPPTNYPRDILV